MNFIFKGWISSKNLNDLDVWPSFWLWLFLPEMAEPKMEAKRQDHPNFSMKSKNLYKD